MYADGRAFREAHSEAIQAEFAQWVENIAAGKSPIGFFKKLGELLRGTIADMQVSPRMSIATCGSVATHPWLLRVLSPLYAGSPG